jgi:hypothetical protein
MSISARVEDAQFLWKSGRKVGALLSMLVAVSATSRKRYPQGTLSQDQPGKEMGDGEAFRRFLGAEFHRIFGLRAVLVRFRGRDVDFVQILWKFVRCELEHDAEIPSDIRFKPAPPDMLAVEVRDDYLGLPDNLIDHLVSAVVKCPENKDMFRT